jgi:hypothetical protein
MAAGLHVLSLLAAVVIASYLILRYARRPTLKRALASAAMLVVPACSASVGVFHRCDSGVPLAQWAIPSLAVVLVVLLVEPLSKRVTAAIVLGTLSTGLTLHYVQIVHGPDWIGNPNSFTLQGTHATLGWHTPVTGLFRRMPRAK